MTNFIKITITPIGSTVKNSKAKIDYEEQLARTSSLIDGDEFWCWDDSRYNKALTGELFAFYFPKTKTYAGNFIIHRIKDVKDPRHRLASWSSNVGQTTRNVLELTPPLVRITYDEWISMNGPISRMGTYTTIIDNKNLNSLFNYLIKFEDNTIIKELNIENELKSGIIMLREKEIERINFEIEEKNRILNSLMSEIKSLELAKDSTTRGENDKSLIITELQKWNI